MKLLNFLGELLKKAYRNNNKAKRFLTIIVVAAVAVGVILLIAKTTGNDNGKSTGSTIEIVDKGGISTGSGDDIVAGGDTNMNNGVQVDTGNDNATVIKDNTINVENGNVSNSITNNNANVSVTVNGGGNTNVTVNTKVNSDQMDNPAQTESTAKAEAPTQTDEQVIKQLPPVLSKGYKATIHQYSPGNETQSMTLFVGPGKEYTLNQSFRPNNNNWKVEAYYVLHTIDENGKSIGMVLTHLYKNKDDYTDNKYGFILSANFDYIEKDCPYSISRVDEVGGTMREGAVPKWGPGQMYEDYDGFLLNQGETVIIYFEKDEYYYARSNDSNICMWIPKENVILDK